MTLPAFLQGLITRQAIARLLSIFLCCLTITVRSFSVLGGPSAFLVLTLKELVFPVQGNVALHLENTILNIIGALGGIFLSSVAKWLATLSTFDSIQSRSIPAIFLVFICFFAGWVKSRYHRLQMSMRIACFVSIWLLTMNIGDRGGVVRDSLFFLWITWVPAMSSLISSLLILCWTSPTFKEVVACFSLLSKSLDDSAAYDDNFKFRQDLLIKSHALNTAYSHSGFELRIGRIGVKELKSYVGIVERLRQELSWGSSNSGLFLCQRQESVYCQPLFESVCELRKAILTSMVTVHDIIEKASLRGAYSFSEDKNKIRAAKETLSATRNITRDELVKLFNPSGLDSDSVPGGNQVSDLCLNAVSFLKMTDELENALLIASHIISLYENSRPRLFFPKPSLAWLGCPPKSVLLTETNAGPVGHEEKPEQSSSQDDDAGLLRYARKTSMNLLFVSKVFRSIKHSRHLRHGLKNAAGVALLSWPAFLPRNSVYAKKWTAAHGQWMIISYVWVLEVNTGTTFRTGLLRLFGTLIGSLYAYITTLLCNTNPFGLVIMTTLVDIPVTWLILYSTIRSMGTVINVTVPPIVFTDYVVTNPKPPVKWLVSTRDMMLPAGILAALLMNTIVFPQHCRVLFLSGAGRVLHLSSQLYLSMCRDTSGNAHSVLSAPIDRSKIQRHELQLEVHARRILNQLPLLADAMRDELSLSAKPVKEYGRMVALLPQFLDTLSGLRNIREHIPREEPIKWQVLPERRELISAISITLSTCENAFRERRPVPRFPSPTSQQALDNLQQQVMTSLLQPQSIASPDVTIYMCTEDKLMRVMIGVLDEIVELSRSLFGSSVLQEMPNCGMLVSSGIAMDDDDDSSFEEEDGLDTGDICRLREEV